MSKLEELQETHAKLESTVMALRSTQEQTARELVDSTTKLREAQASEAKQREKAAAFRADAEKATAELTDVKQDMEKLKVGRRLSYGEIARYCVIYMYNRQAHL